MVQFSSDLKRTIYDFKNSFFPNLVLIHRAKYIFSDMLCLYHFWARIHGVVRKTMLANKFFYKIVTYLKILQQEAFSGLVSLGISSSFVADLFPIGKRSRSLV